MEPATGLSRQTVLLTRPISKFAGKDKFGELLTAQGAHVVRHPVIELLSAMSVDRALDKFKNIQRFACLVFFSSTGVRYFGDILEKLPISTREISSVAKIAAVGHGTAACLREIGFPVDIVPVKSNSQSLAAAVLKTQPGPYLLVRGNRGSDVFADAITDHGQHCEEMLVYKSVNVKEADSKVSNMLEQREIDWVTITSPAIASSTIQLFGDALRSSNLVSISPEVSAVATSAGFEIAAEANSPNFDSMVAAIKKRNGWPA